MNDEMKKISDEVFETAWKRSGTTIADCRYAACDAVLAAQQTPVPGQVTESQILAAQMAWHQAELEGRVSIDSRERKIIEVVAPYVQYGVTLSDKQYRDATDLIVMAQRYRYPIERAHIDRIAEVLSRRAPAEPAAQPLPRVQGDPQFGRSSVEPEAAQLEEPLVRNPFDTMEWGTTNKPEAAQTDRELVDKMLDAWFPDGRREQCGLCKRTDAALGGE